MPGRLPAISGDYVVRADSRLFCEFTHQCEGWDQPRRMVGIRSVEEVIIEGLLFPRYRYQSACYLTSLRRHHWNCTGVTGIAAVKTQIGSGVTLVNEFWANALLWQLGVLAYNLSIWLRLLTDRASSGGRSRVRSASGSYGAPGSWSITPAGGR